MMINLQENMDKQGIRTTQKGVCCVCEKPIVGQVVTALGKNYYLVLEKKQYVDNLRLPLKYTKLSNIDKCYMIMI